MEGFKENSQGRLCSTPFKTPIDFIMTLVGVSFLLDYVLLWWESLRAPVTLRITLEGVWLSLQSPMADRPKGTRDGKGNPLVTLEDPHKTKLPQKTVQPNKLKTHSDQTGTGRLVPILRSLKMEDRHRGLMFQWKRGINE